MRATAVKDFGYGMHSGRGGICCPKCGLPSVHRPLAIYRGRRHGHLKVASVIAPFIKTPVMHGHVCSYCNHLFYVTNHRMPPVYYAWLALLTGTAITVLWLAFKVLHEL